MLHKNPIVQYIMPDKWWKRAKWRLVEDYISYTDMLIPAGFITDGASVPYPLNGFYSPTGRLFEAAIVHDYCIVELGDWDYALEKFRNELEYSKMSKFRKELAIKMVEIWTWYKTR